MLYHPLTILSYTKIIIIEFEILLLAKVGNNSNHVSNKQFSLLLFFIAFFDYNLTEKTDL